MCNQRIQTVNRFQNVYEGQAMSTDQCHVFNQLMRMYRAPGNMKTISSNLSGTGFSNENIVGFKMKTISYQILCQMLSLYATFIKKACCNISILKCSSSFQFTSYESLMK